MQKKNLAFTYKYCILWYRISSHMFLSLSNWQCLEWLISICKSKNHKISTKWRNKNKSLTFTAFIYNWLTLWCQKYFDIYLRISFWQYFEDYDYIGWTSITVTTTHNSLIMVLVCCRETLIIVMSRLCVSTENRAWLHI
jgi:hypothetical protein